MVFGSPWLVYYKLYPGDPQINVPFTSHHYDENYTTWNCLIQSLGEAPVVIDSLKFKKINGGFELVADPSPLYIHASQSDSIAINFMPEEALTYYDTLIIYNNDPLNSVIEVTFDGTGVFDSLTGDLLVVISDCYASPEYHAINYNELAEGVDVTLWQGGTVQYGPFTSNVVGLALQSDIEPGTYDIKFQKIVTLPRDDGKPFDTLMMSATIIIDTGLTIDTVVFPESLMVQSYQWVYDLSHIEMDDVIYAYGAESHNSGNIRDMLDSWLPDLDDDKIESASRLILAQEVFDKMFLPERSLGRQGIDGIADLLHYIMKTTESEFGWLTKLWKLVKIIWELYAGDKIAALMELLQFLMEFIILEIVDTIIDRVGDELPCVDDPLSGGQLICGDEVITAAWNDIKNTYSIWQLPDWGSANGPENSWNYCKELVFDKAKDAFVQGVYVNILTNPQLKKAKEKSASFDYTSDFPTASQNSSDDITRIKVLADDLKMYAGILLFNADLLNKLVVIFDAIGEFLPLPGWLETVKTASMYAAIGQAATATGVAFGGFFAIPNDMKETINIVYDPTAKFENQGLKFAGLPKAKANALLINTLKQKIINSAAEYDSIVTELQTQIQNQEIETSLFSVGDLALADINLMNTVNVSTAPAYALAHALYDNMPGFSGVYDNLITGYSRAGMTRFFTYMSLIQFPGDSSQEMKDYLIAHLDTVSINNQNWTNSSLELLDSIFNIEIPAIVVASEASQNKFGLDAVDDTATITIVLQNVGAVTADSISIVFETNNGISSTSKVDSIFVASLAPLEESATYKWTVVSADTAYHRGVWTVNISSSNAKTYSPDGSFANILKTPTDVNDSEGNILLPGLFELAQNRPNPFNMLTEIEYSIPSRNHVNISVFNLLGQKINTIIDEEKAAGKHTVTWDGTDNDGNNVASGIYFYRLKVGDFEDSRKMLLLK